MAGRRNPYAQHHAAYSQQQQQQQTAFNFQNPVDLVNLNLVTQAGGLPLFDHQSHHNQLQRQQHNFINPNVNISYAQNINHQQFGQQQQLHRVLQQQQHQQHQQQQQHFHQTSHNFQNPPTTNINQHLRNLTSVNQGVSNFNDILNLTKARDQQAVQQQLQQQQQQRQQQQQLDQNAQLQKLLAQQPSNLLETSSILNLQQSNKNSGNFDNISKNIANAVNSLDVAYLSGQSQNNTPINTPQINQLLKSQTESPINSLPLLSNPKKAEQSPIPQVQMQNTQGQFQRQINKSQQQNQSNLQLDVKNMERALSSAQKSVSKIVGNLNEISKQNNLLANQHKMQNSTTVSPKVGIKSENQNATTAVIPNSSSNTSSSQTTIQMNEARHAKNPYRYPKYRVKPCMNCEPCNREPCGLCEACKTPESMPFRPTCMLKRCLDPEQEAVKEVVSIDPITGEKTVSMRPIKKYKKRQNKTEIITTESQRLTPSSSQNSNEQFMLSVPNLLQKNDGQLKNSAQEINNFQLPKMPTLRTAIISAPQEPRQILISDTSSIPKTEIHSQNQKPLIHQQQLITKKERRQRNTYKKPKYIPTFTESSCQTTDTTWSEQNITVVDQLVDGNGDYINQTGAPESIEEVPEVDVKNWRLRLTNRKERQFVIPWKKFSHWQKTDTFYESPRKNFEIEMRKQRINKERERSGQELLNKEQLNKVIKKTERVRKKAQKRTRNIRRRNRRRIRSASSSEDEEDESESSSEESSSSNSEDSGSGSEEEKPPKKRGKATKIDEEATPKRKVGRPPKNTNKVKSMIMEEVTKLTLDISSRHSSGNNDSNDNLNRSLHSNQEISQFNADIRRLPISCMSKIFDFLDQSDLNNLNLVSKNFYNLTMLHRRRLKKSLTIQEPLTRKYIEFIIKYQPEFIDFSKVNPRLDYLEVIFAKCFNLRGVKFFNASLPAILSLTNRETFEYLYNPDPAIREEGSKHRLANLSPMFNLRKFETLIVNFPAHDTFTDKILELIKFDNPNLALKELSLAGCSITNFGIFILSSIGALLISLKSLDLSFCQGLTTEVLEIISRFKNLNSLKLNGCRHVAAKKYLKWHCSKNLWEIKFPSLKVEDFECEASGFDPELDNIFKDADVVDEEPQKLSEVKQEIEDSAEKPVINVKIENPDSKEISDPDVGELVIAES